MFDYTARTRSNHITPAKDVFIAVFYVSRITKNSRHLLLLQDHTIQHSHNANTRNNKDFSTIV